MEFKEKVHIYLNEQRKDPDRVEGGHKTLATRLSRDLRKKITPLQVKNYLKKLEEKDIVGNIKKRAKKSDNPQAYEWGTKYKIIKNHFKS
jgi:hypothetical protein